MNALQHRLDSLRRRVIVFTLWRGFWGILALVAGAGLAACLFDKVLPLPSVLRAVFLLSILGAAAFFAIRFVIYPLARRSDNLSLALRIEEVYPELNDILASAVQFLELPESDLPGSKILRQRAVEQAERRAENCNFNLIFDRRGAFALLFALPVAALLFGVVGAWFFWNHRQLSQTAVLRLADPFGDHTWTQLDVVGVPHRIAKGQPYVIKANLAGIPVQNARLEIQVRTDNPTSRPIVVKWDEAKQTGTLVQPLDMTQQTGKFSFRIIANDARFPRRGAWHEVQVLPPPKLTMLDGAPSPQVELHYPEYTQLSPKRLSAGQGHVDAVAGTRIVWRAAVDRPVAEAWLDLQPENYQILGALGQIPPLWHADPWAFLSHTLLVQSATSRVPVQIDETGTFLTVDFMPWLSGTYNITFKDKADPDLAGDFRGELHIAPDQVPTVQVLRPAGSQSLLPEAQVSFQVDAKDEQKIGLDDIGGIRSVYVEYRRKSSAGAWLDKLPQTFPMYDAAVLENGANRPKRLDMTSKWDLRGKVKEGETIVLQVCAEDYNNLFSPPDVGRSAQIELKIVSKAELNNLLDQDFAKAQQDVVRLKMQQDKAAELVKEIEKDKKGNQQKLVEAEQIQREIQAQVGNGKDEGLLKDLADLKQKMADNQLPPSDLQDRIRTLITELERLQREDFSQIETKLAQTRKDLADPKKQQQETKGKSPLDQAKAMQQDAQKSLEELAKFLDPWASLQQITGETRKLIAQQKEIKKDTDDLIKQEKLSNKEKQTEAGKKAEAENTLAKKAQDLIGMMKEALEKQKGTESGQKLADALNLADKDKVADKMRDIADMFKEQPKPKLNQASGEQKKVIDNLENMLAVLEKQKRDKEIEGLRKKQKNAEKDLKNLAQEMKDLKKKVAEANKIADPQKRAEEMKKLAQEEKDLHEKLQEEARELARLRAERAAKDMANAAQQLEEAGKKLQAGENPEEELQQAEQKIQKAEKDLAEAEEELAREQLARIADNIKGLKERQDAALVESERIHKELERKGAWSQGLLRSLVKSADAQKGLAQEADSLREKLKEAKVFEHILARAGKSMDQAAEAIKLRAEDKAFDPLEKEELAAEKKDQAKIVKYQKEAGDRLQRLLDALKDDPALAQAQKPEQEPMEPKGDEKPDDQAPKLRGGDGVPPAAQIKALRDEQIELQKRTKDFDERNPNRDMLTDDQTQELRDLEDEQANIRNLFNGLVSKGKEKGGDQ